MAWFEKFNLTISGIDFHRYHSDHFIFVRRARSDILVLPVYVDDILLTGSDSDGIVENKMYLKSHFVTKDMGRLKYFLEVEVAHQKYSILSQRKYALDLLEETRFLGCKPANIPMEANVDYGLMTVEHLMIQ